MIAAAGLSACASTGNVQAGIRDPDTASRIRVAMAAESSGQMETAVAMYAAAANAAPGDAEAQARYAGALTRNGQPEEADRVLTLALQRRSDNPMLLLALGQLRLRTGSVTEAMALFDRVLARQPTNVGALNGRGVALDLLGRHGDAQQSYRAAQAADPTNIPAANNLAMSLMLEGRTAEAVPILTSLARRAGATPRVITNLGIAQAAAGDGRAAQATLAGRVDSQDLESIAAGLQTTQARSALEPHSNGARRG